MIFHRLAFKQGPEEGDGPQQLGRQTKKRSGELQIVTSRIILAFALCLLFVVGALVAHVLDFPEGSKGLIHLTEVLVGALVGAFFGERSGASG
jgi:hypothetical protein